MAIPTVINFDTSRIPYEGSPTFRQDASYVWSTLPTVIDSMNEAIVEQNNVSNKITQSEENAKTSETNAAQSATQAGDYANQAGDYANQARGFANYQGDYDSNTVYAKGQSTSFEANIYVSKTDNNTATPIKDTSSPEWYFTGRKDFVYKIITTDTTAVAKDGLDVDTSSNAITVTLPSNPNVNDTIKFLDLKGTFDTNNLTVAGNGNTIMGVDEDMVVDTKNISFTLRFTNNDWRLV